MSGRAPKHETLGAALTGATDTELFEGMAGGDLSPLGELFDRYHEPVKAFGERALDNRADAADLVQETFLTAARAAASFAPGSGAKPFLIGIAAQLARRRRRSFARLRARLEAFGRAPAAPHKTPEDDLVLGEEAALVDAALARLSHEHREVVLMVDLGGLTGVQTAKALGVPAGTVWRRLHEARAELRARVQRRMR
jgi:RNA polymerase sigma-70 factor (ECF subfamily)